MRPILANKIVWQIGIISNIDFLNCDQICSFIMHTQPFYCVYIFI